MDNGAFNVAHTQLTIKTWENTKPGSISHYIFSNQNYKNYYNEKWRLSLSWLGPVPCISFEPIVDLSRTYLGLVSDRINYPDVILYPLIFLALSQQYHSRFSINPYLQTPYISIIQCATIFDRFSDSTYKLCLTRKWKRTLGQNSCDLVYQCCPLRAFYYFRPSPFVDHNLLCFIYSINGWKRYLNFISARFSPIENESNYVTYENTLFLPFPFFKLLSH